jgi:hypothetical protein
VIISGHAALRFQQRIHDVRNPKEILADLYVRSIPATWQQRLVFGVVMEFPGAMYRRVLYWHPDRHRQVELLLVVREECIVTVLCVIKRTRVARVHGY